jgi:phospholipase C
LKLQRSFNLPPFILVILFLTASIHSPMESNSPSTTPIEHIILIVQENHSFDNYFGTYPTANGSLVNPITSTLARVNGIPDGVCLTYPGGCISPRLETAPSPQDPVEGQQTYENDYGMKTNFATSSGPQSMVYFDYRTIPAYWDYAEEYGLADNYFAAALSMTTPNRLLLLSGDTPVAENYGPPPHLQYNQTILGQLSKANVSWGYYDNLTQVSTPSDMYPLNYIAGLPPDAQIRNLSSLYQELSQGSGLPSVSFVNSLGNPALSEHPPASPTIGEEGVVSIVNSVMKSSYWSSTAILITWDEGGGYYDHVTPPREFTIDHGFPSPLLGLGQRVPLVVISPFCKQGYVSHEILSHLSILHFIEFNWGLSPLNKNVANSNVPLDFFNFGQSPRAPIVLTSSGNYSESVYPIPVQNQPSGTPSRILSPVPEGTAILLLIPVIAGASALVLLAWRRRHPRPPSNYSLVEEEGSDRKPNPRDDIVGAGPTREASRRYRGR